MQGMECAKKKRTVSRGEQHPLILSASYRLSPVCLIWRAADVMLLPLKRIEFTFFPACAIFSCGLDYRVRGAHSIRRVPLYLSFFPKHIFFSLSQPTFFPLLLVNACIHLNSRGLDTRHTNQPTHTTIDTQIKTFFALAKRAASASFNRGRQRDRKIPKKKFLCVLCANEKKWKEDKKKKKERQWCRSRLVDWTCGIDSRVYTISKEWLVH